VDQKAGGSSIGFQIFHETIDRLLQEAASGPEDQKVLFQHTKLAVTTVTIVGTNGLLGARVPLRDYITVLY
jgi:Trk-type K+ transport system membrane component